MCVMLVHGVPSGFEHVTEKTAGIMVSLICPNEIDWLCTDTLPTPLAIGKYKSERGLLLSVPHTIVEEEDVSQGISTNTPSVAVPLLRIL